MKKKFLTSHIKQELWTYHYHSGDCEVKTPWKHNLTAQWLKKKQIFDIIRKGIGHETKHSMIPLYK